MALTLKVRYDSSVMSFEQSQDEKMLLVFDPGGTTGVALLDGEDGSILRTEAYSPSEALGYARRMAVQRRAFTPPRNFRVVIEKGPEWHHNSPITRSVEVKLREIFPDAHLVTPNRWKGHPAAKCAERVPTRHEKDAVRLGRWFLSKRSTSAEDPKQVEGEASGRAQGAHTVTAHSSRSRRINN